MGRRRKAAGLTGSDGRENAGSLAQARECRIWQREAAAQDSSGLDAFTRYELKNLEDMEADISGKASEIAKELTATVARAVASARLSDRCADVAEGLYSPEIAARKLGMPEQMFLEAMDQKGLRLPAEAGNCPGAGNRQRTALTADRIRPLLKRTGKRNARRKPLMTQSRERIKGDRTCWN